MSCQFVDYLYRQDDENEEGGVTNEERLLEHEEVSKLESIVAHSIHEAAGNGTLIDAPHLKKPLDCWRDWGNPEAPQEWVDQGLDEEFNLIEFIDAMSAMTTINWTTPVYYVDPRWLYEWIDEDDIEGGLDALTSTGLSEEEISIIDRYEEGKQKLENGQDPSEAQSWFGF